MMDNFYNKFIGNIYSKTSTKSDVTSQILFGEKFTILNKNKDWFKIKTSFDNYIGFIKKSKFIKIHNPDFKVFSPKSPVFKKINNNFVKTSKYLYFSSTVSNLESEKNYIRFGDNIWVNRRNLKSINYVEKNFKKILKLFLNTKYLWGGKSIDGIDCSALIQIFFKFNRVFFPRDTKDQVKFCKKKSLKKYQAGDIIFWKGHVGLCLNQSKFIHAYGPRKKVLIMGIKETINRIDKTANLKIKKVSNIRNY